MTSINDKLTYEVDPSRLSTGSWSHELNRQIGEGDIHASYSADRIGMGKPVRIPFKYAGCHWVCVDFSSRPAAEAYRLIHLSEFDGEPTTYVKKVHIDGGECARSDPMGFYHGMTVQSAGRDFVLSGPSACFIPGQESQLSLF